MKIKFFYILHHRTLAKYVKLFLFLVWYNLLLLFWCSPLAALFDTA